ncbi:long-subunit acyl-CoA synthetase (AMP-forming) [Xenorhabdus cabanillasii]|uniref:Long-subunit acyl-CoA synthetase (AMP-forming) n=1 Tax=Xenorhabdus cabanillasii TaxID=351673 RepID=A0A3D9UV23_9GAMM|nr:AMP-binding protein [Xenorhabdus cabanillasii]REF28601.1 long-subunit acyl-CoA synthetase (AMP-forming) [Xenorhabdus cabanillasii]
MKNLNTYLMDSIKKYKNKIAAREYTSLNHSSPLSLTYHDIEKRAAKLQCELLSKIEKIKGNKNITVGIICRNSTDWIIADLSCLFTGLISLPLPHAFSYAQAHHLASKCDLFIFDKTGEETLDKKWGIQINKEKSILLDDAFFSALENKILLDLTNEGGAEICKVIHTSGTTSTPKGVKLKQEAIIETFKNLSSAIPKESQKEYLSLVPLSLLLEQMTAIYLPFIHGGTVNFLPKNMPLIGENKCDITEILNWIKEVKPTAMTVPPVVIEALLNAVEQGDETLYQYLKFVPHITCGGARVDVRTLEQLRSLGIDAYQGYGLSENASVVSVNTPQFNRLGSVGRPLPHVEVRIADENSIEIRSSSLFSGYSGYDPSVCYVDEDGWLNTGDIGYLDEENYLYVSGRKKNIICLPNGRNVYPEKIESEVQNRKGVISSTLFLDDKKGMVILLKVDPSKFKREEIEDWMDKEYSDVERPEQLWIVNKNNPTLDSLFTVTGRPKREEIKKFYQKNNF